LLRALAVAHIVLAILLSLLTLAGDVLAPVFMIGPVWGAVPRHRRAPHLVRPLGA